MLVCVYVYVYVYVFDTRRYMEIEKLTTSIKEQTAMMKAYVAGCGQQLDECDTLTRKLTELQTHVDHKRTSVLELHTLLSTFLEKKCVFVVRC